MWKTPIKFGESAVVYGQTVCFTDLPLTYCDEHTAIYGKFGIGFKKSFIKTTGAIQQDILLILTQWKQGIQQKWKTGFVVC